MIRNIIYTLSIALILMACNNESQDSAPGYHDPATTTRHTVTSIHATGNTKMI